MRRRQQLRLEGGQVLLVVAIALPLFFTVCAFVVDGANLMVHRRSIQNAADAAALAAARGLAGYQNVTPGIAACDSSWASEKNTEPRKTIIPDVVEDYSTRNDGPSTLDGGSCSWDERRCSGSGDSNCYTWPYKGSNGLLEVRLRGHVGGFFATVAHLSLFDVSARAVASVAAITEDHCEFTPPDVVDPDQYLPNCVIPGQPRVGARVGATSGVGFFKSTDCPAITYTGSGQGDIGALVTNGGFSSSGSSNKTITYLGVGKRDTPGCWDNSAPASIGSPGCIQATCADGPFAPMDWALQPPPYPTPPGCTPVYSSWTVTAREKTNRVATLTTALPHFLQVGQTVTVAGVGGGFNGTVVVTAVPSPTRFSYSANGSDVNPIASGGTVTFGSLDVPAGWEATHPPGIYCVLGDNVAGTTLALHDTSLAVLDLTGGAGYSFFASNLSVVGGKYKCYQFCTPTPSGTYPTLFYATGNIAFSGNGPIIVGYIFAPNGEISFTGGGVNGGDGFLEAQTLKVAGNFATYTGRGPLVGGHCDFSAVEPPPVVNPDQYLPTCVIPGTDRQGTRVTNVTGANIGMDE